MNTGETRNCQHCPKHSRLLPGVLGSEEKLLPFAMRPELLRDARLRRVRRTTPFGVFDKWGEMYFSFSSPYIPDRSGMHGFEGVRKTTPFGVFGGG